MSMWYWENRPEVHSAAAAYAREIALGMATPSSKSEIHLAKAQIASLSTENLERLEVVVARDRVLEAAERDTFLRWIADELEKRP